MDRLQDADDDRRGSLTNSNQPTSIRQMNLFGLTEDWIIGNDRSRRNERKNGQEANTTGRNHHLSALRVYFLRTNTKKKQTVGQGKR